MAPALAIPLLYSNLQDVDKDPHAGGDEHDIGVNVVVPVGDPQHCLIYQHTSDHPDDQDRDDGAHHLWRGRRIIALSEKAETQRTGSSTKVL